MANDFIQLIRNVTTATEEPNLLSAIVQYRSGVSAIRAVLARMKHMNDDMTVLEGVFGVPPTRGADAFALLDGTITAIDASGYATDLQNKIG